jgi:hypothetical protein
VYRVRFRLELRPGANSDEDGHRERIIREVRARSREAAMALLRDGGTRHRREWPLHEEDLRVISEEYPVCIFALQGAGDDPYDLWIKFFHGGRMQRAPAEIIFPKFDKDALK